MVAVKQEREIYNESVRNVVRATLVGAVTAVLAVSVVVVIAKALGAPSDFRQFSPGIYIIFTVLGVIGGAVGWHVVAGRARQPRYTLMRLVPAVLALSFIPDILLGVSGSAWSGVAALMVMHLTVGAIAVTTYLKMLPLPADRPGRVTLSQSVSGLGRA